MRFNIRPRPYIASIVIASASSPEVGNRTVHNTAPPTSVSSACVPVTLPINRLPSPFSRAYLWLYISSTQALRPATEAAANTASMLPSRRASSLTTSTFVTITKISASPP
ncbi:hypothetical protein D3C75_1087430 [compost metagenome]